MVTCQFPKCGAVLNESGRGYFVKKYCHPHQEAISRAKRKQHIKNQIERKKLKLMAKKLKLDPRCETCNISILTYSLNKKYCPRCEKLSGSRADKTYRRRRNMKNTFNAIQVSLINNLKVYITSKEYARHDNCE